MFLEFFDELSRQKQWKLKITALVQVDPFFKGRHITS